MEVDSPCARWRASQRIRGLADERNTAINYNNRLGARLVVGRRVKIAIGRRSAGPTPPAPAALPTPGGLLGCPPPRQRPGVSMFGISFVSDCAESAALYSAPALDFFAGSQVDPCCMACATFVGGPAALQRGQANRRPTALQPRPTSAVRRPVWSFRSDRNRVNFAPPHPNRQPNRAQTRAKHAQTRMQFEESTQTLLSVSPPSCV